MFNLILSVMEKVLETLVGKKTDRKVRVSLKKERYDKNGHLRRRVDRETDYEQEPHCCECETTTTTNDGKN